MEVNPSTTAGMLEEEFRAGKRAGIDKMRARILELRHSLGKRYYEQSEDIPVKEILDALDDLYWVDTSPEA